MSKQTKQSKKKKRAAKAKTVNTKSIVLESEDAALVVKANGELSVYLPTVPESELDKPVEGPTLEVFKMAVVFKDPQMLKLIDQRFDELMEEAAKHEKDD